MLRRKVALAMVLLHDSSVLLLDEPFNGLDPEAQHQLRAVIRELRSSGTSIVLSSHRLWEPEAPPNCHVVLATGNGVGARNLAQLPTCCGPP